VPRVTETLTGTKLSASPKMTIEEAEIELILIVPTFRSALVTCMLTFIVFTSHTVPECRDGMFPGIHL